MKAALPCGDSGALLFNRVLPWKKRPLGCCPEAPETASHTMVSAPMASVRSLFCILAWKSGMDNWTAKENHGSQKTAA